ncbi:MAG TPA: hypothetical protein PKO33_16270 [Pyrinomonadaceae bacterium]|nr:hypothetical protein [Pyrinomonadaceae bacterium]
MKGTQGNVIARRDFKPFGEEITNNTGERTVATKYGVADNLKQKFTTYQRDEESGLDFARNGTRRSAGSFAWGGSG